MANPTFAEKMVTKLETLLAASAGLASVTFDGQTTTYVDLAQQHAYWQARVAKEQGQRPRLVPCNLGGV